MTEYEDVIGCECIRNLQLLIFQMQRDAADNIVYLDCFCNNTPFLTGQFKNIFALENLTGAQATVALPWVRDWVPSHEEGRCWFPLPPCFRHP